MKKIFYIFIVSLVLNFIWENLHSFLYSGYEGGKITEFVLLQVSLGDAFITTLLVLPFIYINFFRIRRWLLVVFLLIVAACIEWYWLRAGRWAYNDLMPIIPILKLGLTPIIQLAILGMLSLKIVEDIDV